MLKSFLNFLKKLPVDLGQGKLRYTTKGKLIALELVEKLPASLVQALDVGCREGYYSNLLLKMGYQVTSIDIEKSYQNCQIVDANHPLPYTENTFDLIWCSEVIEHLNNPQTAIQEFRRLLKPSGQAIITTPNSHFWLYKLLNVFGLTPRKLQNPTHQHFFELADIKKFRPEQNCVYGFFPYAILKFKIRNMVGLLSPTFVFVVKKE